MYQNKKTIMVKQYCATVLRRYLNVVVWLPPPLLSFFFIFIAYTIAGEPYTGEDAGSDAAAEEHPQHGRHRPCGPWQDHADWLAIGQGRPDCLQPGWWQASHRHPQRWTGKGHYHQVNVSWSLSLSVLSVGVSACICCSVSAQFTSVPWLTGF